MASRKWRALQRSRAFSELTEWARGELRRAFSELDVTSPSFALEAAALRGADTVYEVIVDRLAALAAEEETEEKTAAGNEKPEEEED